MILFLYNQQCICIYNYTYNTKYWSCVLQGAPAAVASAAPSTHARSTAIIIRCLENEMPFDFRGCTAAARRKTVHANAIWNQIIINEFIFFIIFLKITWTMLKPYLRSSAYFWYVDFRLTYLFEDLCKFRSQAFQRLSPALRPGFMRFWQKCTCEKWSTGGCDNRSNVTKRRLLSEIVRLIKNNCETNHVLSFSSMRGCCRGSGTTTQMNGNICTKRLRSQRYSPKGRARL